MRTQWGQHSIFTSIFIFCIMFLWCKIHMIWKPHPSMALLVRWFLLIWKKKFLSKCSTFLSSLNSWNLQGVFTFALTSPFFTQLWNVNVDPVLPSLAVLWNLVESDSIIVSFCMIVKSTSNSWWQAPVNF